MFDSGWSSCDKYVLVSAKFDDFEVGKWESIYVLTEGLCEMSGFYSYTFITFGSWPKNLVKFFAARSDQLDGNIGMNVLRLYSTFPCS